MLPGCVDELGVALDLVYLGLGAVALHIRLPEHLVEVGILVYAVDGVPGDLLLPLGPTRVATKKDLSKDRMFPCHLCSSSTLRSSTKTSSHSPLLVEMSEWTETTSAPVCFSTMPSRTSRPASRTCWRMALMSLRPSKLLASCFSAGVSTPKLRTITRSSTIRVRILSGPRPTNSCWKAIISSLMVASVLLCRRATLLAAPPRFGRGAATTTTKAGAAPHLYTHRGDAVTGPRSAGHPGISS